MRSIKYLDDGTVRLVEGERELVLKAGEIVEAEAAVFFTPVVATGRVWKSDIWRRATDAEAEIIVAALGSQPVRLRRLFDDATFLDPDDPLFSGLRAGFVTAFGEKRAAELLAPGDA